MKGLSISYITLLLLFVSSPLLGQTYTYNPTKTGCSNSWTDGNCWDKVNIVGCSFNSGSTYPPLVSSASLPGYNSIKNNCTVNVIINEHLTLDPGFDFAFLGPAYNITLAEGVSLNIPRHVYLLERGVLTFLHASGTGAAQINIDGNIYYEKQANLNLRDGTTLEVTNVLNPSTNQYEGILFQVDPQATLRIGGTLSFTNGNSNKVIVEGTFEVMQLNLDAGNSGTTPTAIASKNALVVKGSGSSNVCSGINIKGDSYLLVEAGGALNLVSLELAGSALFDIYGTTQIKSMTVLGDSWMRMFAGSQFDNQSFTKTSGSAKIFKCGTEVALPTTAVGGCTAGYTLISAEEDWDEFTGDWCFRKLPIKLLEEELLYLEESNTVRLNWVTTAEWENSHFEIERSVKGIEDFVQIGIVKGAGWSNEQADYSFEDKDYPMTGDKLYYRIRQVDANGRHSYGKLMTVTPLSLHKSFSSWYLYPNPNNGIKLMVRLGEILPGKEISIRFRIINTFGGTEEYFVSSEGEMNEVLSGLVSNLPKGINILEVQVGERFEMIKFIVD
ncbi:T9SS type A sorting domain-containing protein [Aquiflexum gelatinilyticum]|uniref:T9SS type A sorting domain-containing protein n=1 Tax=Aquiflexum gelatinilyticum TaxID=2961943 RepID=UPI002169BFBD|nr:T9SS type A sorting domain-containing protein [Aquiflexum gelatinilyticum]MCS4433432.1 T9SS type A sorting domain-containing protein [Aquiflexum gelatinilyticum]